MRIGSLFSGAGGLDMAVQAVFGGCTVWHSEIDKAASKVLAHRWPDVPNLGDITKIDFPTIRNWSFRLIPMAGCERVSHLCQCGHSPSYHYGDTGHCEAVDVGLFDEIVCTCPLFEADSDA